MFADTVVNVIVAMFTVFLIWMLTGFIGLKRANKKDED